MGKAFFKTGQDIIESCFLISFRYTDGTGQLNFGFAADAIANNDHFLPLGLGSQYNGTVSLLNSHMKSSGMLRDVNQGFWSHFGCS